MRQPMIHRHRTESPSTTTRRSEMLFTRAPHTGETPAVPATRATPAATRPRHNRSGSRLVRSRTNRRSGRRRRKSTRVQESLHPASQARQPHPASSPRRTPFRGKAGTHRPSSHATFSGGGDRGGEPGGASPNDENVGFTRSFFHMGKLGNPVVECCSLNCLARKARRTICAPCKFSSREQDQRFVTKGLRMSPLFLEGLFRPWPEESSRFDNTEATHLPARRSVLRFPSCPERHRPLGESTRTRRYRYRHARREKIRDRDR